MLGQPRSRYQIDCAGAQIHVHARSIATVLRIDGEVDASNADLITEAIRRFSRLKAPLILDLAGLDFLAASGLRALLALDEEHRQAGLRCSLVSGAVLRRLTRVVPDHGLPIADSVAAALAHIEGATTARRRLISGPARQHEPQSDASTRLRGLAS
ncbi:sulfate transporter [Mycobacterium nebraskense]|uniref:Sulfate transporter n=1 Tax=Mycobacterium nebraskense TaxID=244292 RepID=A0A0F5N8B4_9MYCO|nr:sulfate transporter [Mycobacterium nebraskense]KLO33826.1 sulfate transporter [Mycobacterium nebraskense]ORW22973.1 sulfate transporter [Mycobacterium nebraskense]